VTSVDPFFETYAAVSAEMRASLPCHLDLPYGDTPPERLDIFPAGPRAPVFVFIHGGYWRRLSKDASAFMAGTFTEAGVSVAVVEYALAPAVSIDEIVRQCRSSLAWIDANGKEFGIDSGRIFIGGHSAGGHLAAMLLAGGWHGAFGVSDRVVSGALLVSGLYDLEPVRLSEPNDWARLDEAAAARNSPLLNLPGRECPLVVAWAENETNSLTSAAPEISRPRVQG
jgi:arylformamidase